MAPWPHRRSLLSAQTSQGRAHHSVFHFVFTIFLHRTMVWPKTRERVTFSFVICFVFVITLNHNNTNTQLK